MKSSASVYVPSTSDESVQAKTGKNWAQWFALLDKAGCAKMNHKEIVAVLDQHEISAWWRQMVTVEYERARGLREVYQKTDGFSANGSRTINAPVSVIYNAVKDARTRKRWLSNPLTIRTATENKSVRILWADDTQVNINLYEKGAAKSQITIEHNKLADATAVAEMKTFWAESLNRLKTLLES